MVYRVLVTQVDCEDAIWDDDRLSVTVRVCSEEAHNECGNKLEAKLDIGKNFLPEEKKALV